MIINLLLNVLVLFIGALFSWLPVVTVLPTIADFDIDSALNNGVGQMYTVFNAFWVFGVMFQGFLFLMGYYVLKKIVRFFLGSHSPTD
jgi:hypothetical protein